MSAAARADRRSLRDASLNEVPATSFAVTEDPLGGAARRTSATVSVPLWRAAHGRTGDKGNRSNISVIAWHPELYPLLVEQITEAAVTRHFVHRQPSRVVRYLLPKLSAMNFVLDDVLDGGVNDALNPTATAKHCRFYYSICLWPYRQR